MESTEFPAGTKNHEEAAIPSRPAAAIRNPYAIGRSTASMERRVNTSNNSYAAVSKSISASKIHNATKLPSDEAKEAASLAASLPNNSKVQQQQQQNELAYWERLPSRNVSFTPAEVLTVTECLQSSKLYCDEQQSVRITGILEHRLVRSDDDDDDMVELQLKDPKSTSTAAIAEKTREQRRKSGTFRRKSLSGTKRPWFGSSNKTPSKAPQKYLKVIVDPGFACLPLAVVGSCVTVIGEFVDETRLSARTLAVVPSTNMVLYEQALQLRRKAMYERYYYDNDNDHSSSQKRLLQGCGPPPYDKFNRGEKQHRV